MTRPSRRLLDFNKQILVGEVGSLLGTPIAPWLISFFTADPNVLSLAAVAGGLLGGSLFWLGMKLGDERRSGTASLRNLAGDIAFFTPAALVTGFIFYQPTLFLVARHLLATGHGVFVAACIGQFAAFSLFLVAINLYRAALRRWVGKQL